MKKIALITNPISGIGSATAFELKKQNINLILCGRRQERLDCLQQVLAPKVKIHTLNFDVGNRKAVFLQHKQTVLL